jgi:4-amino-4-deoxy-L-arabinose transferase-like glycosyltransferase
VKYATWAIVAFMTLARGFAAWKVPLTGDEAYYWEWAKHLALGYADHPPMVAYLILPFAWITANPLWVRLGFLACGVVATLAAAGTAKRLAGDERAGMVTALAMMLTPMLSVGFVIATPDGPLMAGWACSLYFTVRAWQTRARRDFIILGVAIAFALLSKMFAYALVAGLVAWSLAPGRRSMWREGLWLSALIAFVLYIPFLVWNAQHEWISFAFALQQRHVSEPSLFRPFIYMFGANMGAYSPGLWIAALVLLVRPRSAIVGWTAIPLTALLVVLNFHERIELHWIFGPYVSLCVAMGVAFVSLAHRPKIIWATAAAVPSAILIPFLFFAAAFPGQLYSQFRLTGSTLRNSGPFEIFTYWPLAQDVKHLADANDAVVVTDGYGFSSQMDFEAGIAPVVIGYAHQGQEAKRWYDENMHPARILFVDKTSLFAIPGNDDNRGRPDFARVLAEACGTVRSGPEFEYSYTDPTGHTVPARRYYSTWCDSPKPNALRILDFDT